MISVLLFCILTELALDVFDSAGELLFADQGNDICDTQSA